MKVCEHSCFHSFEVPPLSPSGGTEALRAHGESVCHFWRNRPAVRTVLHSHPQPPNSGCFLCLSLCPCFCLSHPHGWDVARTVVWTDTCKQSRSLVRDLPAFFIASGSHEDGHVHAGSSLCALQSGVWNTRVCTWLRGARRPLTLMATWESPTGVHGGHVPEMSPHLQSFARATAETNRLHMRLRTRVPTARTIVFMGGPLGRWRVEGWVGSLRNSRCFSKRLIVPLSR